MVDNFFSIGDAYNIVLDEFKEEFTISIDPTDIHTGLFDKFIDRNTGMDTQYLLTNTYLKQGNIINKNDINYLIIDKNNENYQNSYKKYYIEECNYIVKIIKDNQILNFNAILTTKNFDLSQGIFLFQNGNCTVTLQNNDNSQRILIDDRFILMKQAWKCIGIDTSAEGLITLYLQTDSITSGDNLDLEIANYDTLIIYRVDLLNNNAIINMGSTGQIQAQLTNTSDSTAVDGATFTYTSNNSDIATVDENGVITPVTEGTGTVTVNSNDSFANGATATFNYTIQVEVTHNYTNSITGTTPVHLSSSDTYTYNAFDNGNAISDIATWTLLGDDGASTTYASITSHTDTTCTIQITSEYIFDDGLSKYVRLHAVGQTITSDTYIRIKLIQ